MIPAPKRRWFRFSLRTMFVAVTVLGGWLGWNIHFVQERQSLRDRLKNTPTFREAEVDMSTQPTSIPIWREWLGDKPVVYLNLHVPMNDEGRRVRYYFPEAYVIPD